MKTRASLIAVAVAVFAALALPQAAEAQVADVAVLQSEMTDVKAAIIRIDRKFDRIDEKFDRMDASIVEIKENAARTDERINAMQMQNQFIVIPLLLLTLASLIGLLTKGILWGVDRAPKASATSRPAQTPPQQFHPS